ncbi:MAG: prepilin peptidase [Candidatus Omnitrophica bacterium]|nr:prepilin peptidase [Candidatus Omnitrophota bacterium]
MPDIIIKIFIFVFGALIGSFLNVCIYRMPRDMSVNKPKRSFCPHCQKQVLWYDNIPFFSYMALGGKCRFCKKPISFRYFLVELITASLLIVLYYFFGLTVYFFVYGVLACALIVSTFIDFDFQIIPDEITLGGLVAGIILCTIFPQLHYTSSRIAALIQVFFGILAGGGSIYLIGKFGEFVFKKESMGGGDVKLMAMIGALMGWQFALLIFFLAPFFGAIVGITAKLTRGAEVIPYGPYLSLATIIAILWGKEILGYLFFI